VIAVNSTIFSAPFADICYAWDKKWWTKYLADVKRLGCRRITAGKGRPGCEEFPRVPQREFSEDAIGGNNSGHQAVNLAYMLGAKEIIMLGFDCQHTDGEAHHHGDHPKPLGNATNCQNWLPGFRVLSERLRERGVKVVNCSPRTALDCFERHRLEDYLNGR
jgi:hypothetical protein